MSGDKTNRKIGDESGVAVDHDGMWQVVLYNDSHNLADYVVACLVRVFGHSQGLAKKIMLEAHRKGRAIAEVEGRDEAVLHKGQLQSCGLTASVEQV